MNNWISRSTDQTGVTKRTLYYGAGGDLVQDQRVGATTYSYTYNHHKRMTGVQVGGSYVGTYGFDALGARVWRQATSPVAVSSQYVYDKDGHLLAGRRPRDSIADRRFLLIGAWKPMRSRGGSPEISNMPRLSTSA